MGTKVHFVTVYSATAASILSLLHYSAAGARNLMVEWFYR